MVKLRLELEGEVGEVIRALRRIGGGNYAGGEVRDGRRPDPVEGRTAAAGAVLAPGTTAAAANLPPGRWTQELAGDFTAGPDVVARRMMLYVWRAGERGIHRSALCQRADLTSAEPRSLLMRMGHARRRFQEERRMALWRPVSANRPLRSYFVDPDFAAVATSQMFGGGAGDR